MAIFDPSKPDVKKGPAPQGDNPDNQHTAQGVTPGPLKSTPDAVPAVRNTAGLDIDSRVRAAKHQLAAADADGDEKAEAVLENARKARQLVSERNASTDPARVEAIDREIESLGFAAPVANTDAQRSDAPVGRRAPGRSKTA